MLRLLVTGSMLVVALLLLWVRRGLLVVTVRQNSMFPALQNGDRVLVVRHWPGRWLRKGQIVVVWPSHVMAPYPDDPASGTPFIKRVVGLSRERIVTSIEELHDILRPRYMAAHDSEGKRMWDIPAGHIFVLGDHVPRGFDSLTWGPVPLKCVLGVVVMKLPPKRPHVKEVK
jgi:signal peptidase I